MFNYNQSYNTGIITDQMVDRDREIVQPINEQYIDVIKEEYNNLQEYLTRLKVLTKNLATGCSIITRNNNPITQEDKDELIDQYQTLYKYIYHHTIGMHKIMKVVQKSINNNISILIQLKEEIERYNEPLFKMCNEENKFEQMHQTYEQTIDKVNSFEQYQPINLQDLGLFSNLSHSNPQTQINPDRNIINLQDTSDALQRLNSDFTTHITELPFDDLNIESSFKKDDELNDDFIIEKNKSE